MRNQHNGLFGKIMRASSILAIIILVVAISCLGLTVYGLYLAFSASIILGIIVLLLQPTPLILALVALISRPTVCEELAKWLNLPF